MVSAADFLLRLGHGADADRLIAERRDSLQHMFYGSLTNLAREHGAARIEMFCYRALLDDVLDERRNRAYGHAARYFRHLGKLDATIDSYAPAVTHEEYVADLRARHGRKYSFWSHVDRVLSATVRKPEFLTDRDRRRCRSEAVCGLDCVERRQ